jgi:hypothetical protein
MAAEKPDPDERFSIEGDPDDVLRSLLQARPDAEAWAREHVAYTTTDHHKNGLTWVAQIKADGLIFEGRATGPAPKRDALRERAADAAIRDYLDFVNRNG